MASGPRTVVVTGAAAGLGRECALAHLEAGDRVVGVDRDGEGLASVPGLVPVVGDVGDPRVRAAALAVHERLDVIVNAAGIALPRRLDEVTEDDWDLLFAVNAKALFFWCRDAAQHMPAGGSLVNFASVAARTGGSTPVSYVYAATKATVLSLTRSFATEYGPRGIRANAVLPGMFETAMNEAVLATSGSTGREAAAPLGRYGRPRECADVVLWLSSPAASFVTGQGIAVDGGMTMA